MVLEAQSLWKMESVKQGNEKLLTPFGRRSGRGVGEHLWAQQWARAGGGLGGRGGVGGQQYSNSLPQPGLCRRASTDRQCAPKSTRWPLSPSVTVAEVRFGYHSVTRLELHEGGSVTL